MRFMIRSRKLRKPWAHNAATNLGKQPKNEKGKGMTIKKAAKRFLENAKIRRPAVKKKPAIKMLDKDEIESIIREQAYKLYEQRGYSNGCDVIDWLEAEKIVTKV